MKKRSRVASGKLTPKSQRKKAVKAGRKGKRRKKLKLSRAGGIIPRLRKTHLSKARLVDVDIVEKTAKLVIDQQVAYKKLTGPLQAALEKPGTSDMRFLHGMPMMAMMSVAKSKVSSEVAKSVPVILGITPIEPTAGESYQKYKKRVMAALSPIHKKVTSLIHTEPTFLVMANALSFHATSPEIKELAKEKAVKRLELNSTIEFAAMDQAVQEIGCVDYQSGNPGSDGSGVKVAVLDSGIDTQHPHLNVSQSISTCGEDIDVPGDHATHVAGAIASQYGKYRGVAPGVTLLNIKVLKANNKGNSSDIEQGIDRALEMGADIISLSIGSNHLPESMKDGNDWECLQGDCTLCSAVNRVARLENVVVVASAGNNHLSAAEARKLKHKIDTELDCPGQAVEAITVGAVSPKKDGYAVAAFSSHGPTSYNFQKPDIVAYGVKMNSTITVPRINGKADQNADPGSLFARKSGTSMAVPLVTGAVALIIQNMRRKGLTVTVNEVKKALFAHVKPIPGSDPLKTGHGRLDISQLG